MIKPQISRFFIKFNCLVNLKLALGMDVIAV